VGEDDALRGFFAATRRGMVETLRFQAEARSLDLLWNPVEVARDVQRVIERVRPDHVIVDHLAFSARLALKSAGIRHADVVLGHPTALPVGSEVYGFVSTWPEAFTPDHAELDALHRLCGRVRDSFTVQWNDALLQLDPGATLTADAFTESGDVLMLNYPVELHDESRRLLLPPHAFLGSAVRDDEPDAEARSWLARDGAPVVYVSFGSFLSVRDDVLARVVEALRPLDVRVALATGSTDPAALGAIPGSWLVREFLPQVSMLRGATLAVSHAGNNSVTEAMTHGVPLLLLPFSTDQFAGAASLELAGFGEALDPNTASPAEIRAAAIRMLSLDGIARERLDRLSASLAADAGPGRAFDALRVVPEVR
jgi:UDP:flavonoid glycosyltransferase YjiC (YdhE family)